MDIPADHHIGHDQAMVGTMVSRHTKSPYGFEVLWNNHTLTELGNGYGWVIALNFFAPKQSLLVIHQCSTDQKIFPTVF